MNFLLHAFILACVTLCVSSFAIKGREPRPVTNSTSQSPATSHVATTTVTRPSSGSDTAPTVSSRDAGTTTCWTPIGLPTVTTIPGEPSIISSETTSPTITTLPSVSATSSTSDWIGGTMWCTIVTLPGTTHTTATLCS